MPDREKVIKDLEFCVNGHFKVELSLATKILSLLKEQEALPFLRIQILNIRKDGKMSEIRKAIPLPELMAGLAEECSELAQAALKLRRVWDKTNPTPMTEDMAIERLYEEIADVRLYLNQIDINMASIEEIMAQKEARWKRRISEMG